MCDATDEIRRALDALDAAWRERRFTDLAACFDDQVVMRGPGLVELVRGRDALVKSYADFMTRSDLTEYVESNHAVDRWGDTAVARFDWSMAWIQNGKTDRASGQDLFVFQKRGTRWVAIERVMLY
jgi:ketosteroid isomerase-like protein